MLQQNQQSALPETIRVKVQRGFRCWQNGRIAAVNPGDVVEVPRALALEMRGAGKAYMVEDAVNVQANFVPERKRLAKAGSAKSVN